MLLSHSIEWLCISLRRRALMFDGEQVKNSLEYALLCILPGFALFVYERKCMHFIVTIILVVE